MAIQDHDLAAIDNGLAHEEHSRPRCFEESEQARHNLVKLCRQLTRQVDDAHRHFEAHEIAIRQEVVKLQRRVRELELDQESRS